MVRLAGGVGTHRHNVAAIAAFDDNRLRHVRGFDLSSAEEFLQFAVVW